MSYNLDELVAYKTSVIIGKLQMGSELAAPVFDDDILILRTSSNRKYRVDL